MSDFELVIVEIVFLGGDFVYKFGVNEFIDVKLLELVLMVLFNKFDGVFVCVLDEVLVDMVISVI